MSLKNLSGAIIVIIITAIPLFGHLSELPIQRWDEARLAGTAYEMSHKHNWLVPTHGWQPDMLSLKPPLQIWLMAGSIKLFGANELAIRLPSALAALATCLFLYWFLTVKIKNRLLAILAPALLIVSEGYVRLHGTRTGDYDTLLTLFTTIFLLYFYLYLRDKNPKNIIAAAVALTLACFTKGVTALMLLPGILLVILYTGQLIPLLRTKQFYIGLGIFIVFVPGYYLLREHYNPGFLHAVAKNELGGRFLRTLEYHHQPWYFYFVKLLKTGGIGFALSLLGVILATISTDKNIRSFSAFLFFMVVSFLAVISCAGTKLDWYNMPVYPLLSILAGMAIYGIINKAKKIQGAKSHLKYVFILVPIGAFYALSYNRILDNVLRPQMNLYDPDIAIGAYLNDINKGKKGMDKVTILYSDIEQDMLWYEHIDSNINLKSVLKLSPGNIVIAFKAKSIEAVEGNYDYTLLEQYYRIHRYRITAVKDNPLILPE